MTLATGASGPDVTTVQAFLRTEGATLPVDGSFGPLTREAVRRFQASHGLVADGVVGIRTLEAAVGATLPPSVLREGDSGVGVLDLQRLLDRLGGSLAEDGVFGPATRLAVVRFQSQRGLAADGIVGRDTWRALADPVVRVVRGDTVLALASRYGVSVRAVARQNSVNPNRIYPGETLVMPVFDRSIPSGAPSTSGTSTATSSSSSSSSSTSSQPPSSTATSAVKWGGAATSSLALGFYGPPDSVLLGAVTRLGVPVVVFLTSAPTGSVPGSLVVGVDARAGTNWAAVAKTLARLRTGPLYALVAPRTALQGRLFEDGLLPVVPGAVLSGTSDLSLKSALLQGAVGGELMVLPLSGAGLRAASEAIPVLESGGYQLRSLRALVGP